MWFAFKQGFKKSFKQPGMKTLFYLLLGMLIGETQSYYGWLDSPRSPWLIWPCYIVTYVAFLLFYRIRRQRNPMWWRWRMNPNDWCLVDEIGLTLARAADHMELHGWCRFHHEKADGSTCPLGAIRRVGWEHAEMARLYLEKYLKMSLVEWNDFWCESKEQAVATLREAARWY